MKQKCVSKYPKLYYNLFSDPNDESSWTYSSNMTFSSVDGFSNTSVRKLTNKNGVPLKDCFIVWDFALLSPTHVKDARFAISDPHVKEYFMIKTPKGNVESNVNIYPNESNVTYTTGTREISYQVHSASGLFEGATTAIIKYMDGGKHNRKITFK